jgi:UDP-glucose 4-epimerase
VTESAGEQVASAVASLAGSSVLVTGGAGYLGSRLASTLAGACDVTVIDDLTTGVPDAVPDEATFVEGDVRDVGTLQPAVSDADVVVHLAVPGGVERSVRAPGEIHGRVASGTVAVLEAVRRAGGRVVVGSSAAVYGEAETLPVHETDPKTPVSPYGAAALAADQYTRIHADLYDLSAVTLRYFNVYGPNRPPTDVLGRFVERARADRPLVVHGDGSQTRDFVHIGDALRATLLAATGGTAGRAYNVGTGTGTSIDHLAELVSRATDSASDVVYRKSRRGDVTHSRAATDRAREELDYRSTTDVREGIESVVEAPPTDSRLTAD